MKNTDVEVGRRAAYSLLVGVKTAKATAEMNVEVLRKARNRFTTYTIWIYTQRPLDPTVEVLAHPCSLDYYSIHNSQEMETACVSINQ